MNDVIFIMILATIIVGLDALWCLVLSILPRRAPVLNIDWLDLSRTTSKCAFAVLSISTALLAIYLLNAHYLVHHWPMMLVAALVVVSGTLYFRSKNLFSSCLQSVLPQLMIGHRYQFVYKNIAGSCRTKKVVVDQSDQGYFLGHCVTRAQRCVFRADQRVYRYENVVGNFYDLDTKEEITIAPCAYADAPIFDYPVHITAPGYYVFEYPNKSGEYAQYMARSERLMRSHLMPDASGDMRSRSWEHLQYIAKIEQIEAGTLSGVASGGSRPHSWQSIEVSNAYALAPVTGREIFYSEALPQGWYRFYYPNRLKCPLENMVYVLNFGHEYLSAYVSGRDNRREFERGKIEHLMQFAVQKAPDDNITTIHNR